MRAFIESLHDTLHVADAAFDRMDGQAILGCRYLAPG